MSSSPWSSFFNEAGIPLASAKNYGSIFEDNRITKEMLLDLDKEILREMGIIIMGDVIAILKHAKKVYNQELKKKDLLSPALQSKSSIKVAPMTHPSLSSNKTPVEVINKKAIEPVNPSPPTVAEPPKLDSEHKKTLDTISTSVQYTTAAYQNQQAAKQLSSNGARKLGEETVDSSSVIPPYGSSLHSDRIISSDAAIQSLVKPVVLEEYTTSTYEARMKKKRAVSHSSLVVSSSGGVSPDKSSSGRLVVIPSSLEKKPHLDKSMERSKRFLEAAGIIETSGFSDSFVSSQAPKHSVFSRLELPENRSPLSSAATQPVKKSVSDIKVRLGKRVSPRTTSMLEVTGTLPKLYSESSDEQKKGSIHDRLGPKDSLLDEPKQQQQQPVSAAEGTMVADSISRHSDVHARLKKQGVSMPSAYRGPLGKRLGQHAVFGRLE